MNYSPTHKHTLIRQFFLVAALSYAAIFLLFSLGCQENTSDENDICIFCQPDFLSQQAFYEDDYVIGLITHAPIYPNHLLIIPKRHVVRYENLNDEEILGIGKLTQKIQFAMEKEYGPTNYYLREKNGKEACQDVMHVHFHYIPVPKTIFSKYRYLNSFYIHYSSFMRQFKKNLTKQEIISETQRIKEMLQKN